MDKYLKQARHERSERQRATLLIFLAPVFVGLLPYLVYWLGSKLDHSLGWAPILSWPLNLLLAVLLMLPGWALAMWSIYSQFTLGRGTPLPLVPTQQLIVQPPFTYCRNPMTLGTILAYLGLALLFRTLGGVIVVLLFGGALMLYIKLVEEKELALRFGQEYLAYKQRTPFMLPRLRSRQ